MVYKREHWPENRMDYRIHVAYRVIIVCCIIFVAFLFCTFRRSIDTQGEQENFQVLETIKEEKVENPDAELGYQMEYTYRLPNISGNYRTLVFYSSYNNVVVKYKGRVVYSMFGPKPGYVIRTSTHSWNHVTFETGDGGKYVTICLIPDYEGIATEPEEVLFGESDKIVRSYMVQDLPSMILSIIAVLIGIVFLVYCILTWKNEELDRNLVMLGVFAICVGLWKMTDSRALSAIIPNSPTLFEIPFFCLSLAPFAFVAYSKFLFKREDHKVWNTLEIIQLLGTTSILLLQIFGIYEFRQTLIVTHVIIILSVLVFIYEIFREHLVYGINKTLRFNVIYLLLCLGGSLWDMVSYYMSQGKSHKMISGITCFVIYIFSMGYFSASKARRLMIEGTRAKEFARLAFLDPLTDIQNRMAYNRYISRDDISLEHLAIAAFDLNDLKKCNDTLGHEKGDIYIKTMAKILEDVFSGVGQAYRMGGDEFTVLVPKAHEEMMENLVLRVSEELKEENKNYPEIHMEVAYGYAIYDSSCDSGIDDISRRADGFMYEKKFSMKQD